MYKFVFLLLLTWCQVLLASKQNNTFVNIVLTDIHTEIYEKDIFKLFDLQLVTYQGHRAVSGIFNLNQVVPNMHVYIVLNFEKPDKTRFEVLNLKINVCNFLNGTYNKLKIAKLAFKELNKQKGFPKKCPIEANTNYTLENYEVNMPKFPLPNLKFLAAVTLYKSDQKSKIIYIGLKGATKRPRS